MILSSSFHSSLWTVLTLLLSRCWPNELGFPRTALWQAPEVLDDDERTDWPRADVYSYAVVLFELQTSKALLMPVISTISRLLYLSGLYSLLAVGCSRWAFLLGSC